MREMSSTIFESATTAGVGHSPNSQNDSFRIVSPACPPCCERAKVRRFFKIFPSLPFPAGTVNKSKRLFNSFSDQSSFPALIDSPGSVRIIIQAFLQSRKIRTICPDGSSLRLNNYFVACDRMWTISGTISWLVASVTAAVEPGIQKIACCW